jgi:hypothetical protein
MLTFNLLQNLPPERNLWPDPLLRRVRIPLRVPIVGILSLAIDQGLIIDRSSETAKETPSYTDLPHQ